MNYYKRTNIMLQ